MKQPEYLKKGDKIAIVATARKISYEEIEAAIKKYKEWGLNVVLGDNIFKQENQFAGIDEVRVMDFQQMLDDVTVKAIICARGGYGTVRIIDKLDFSNFIKNPKWIVGYSDVTVLHSHIFNNFKIETLHACMPIDFPVDGSDTESIISLKKALFGEKISYSFKTGKLSRKGSAQGVLIGGNLSVLYSLLCSNSDIDCTGKILFIEDLDEYLYHIDRMMKALKRAGKLGNLAGLIVGGMSKMRDNDIPFGKTAYEIINETVSEYNYPVCFGFSAGHIPINNALFLGREISLRVDDNESNVVFSYHKPDESKKQAKRIFNNFLFLLLGFSILYLIYYIILHLVLK